MKIVIINYGMGNLRSVEKKFQRVGVNALISSDLELIEKADKLVLPGVGHFASGVKKLQERGIWDLINKKVLQEKVPILGICLGMQLMAKFSEEGNVNGLGWFDAEVVKFRIKDKLKHKIPHMGWNNIVKKKESTLLKDIHSDAMFYFVHSYHMKCNNSEDILTTTNYEYEFVSAIEKENIFGTQFHPEKSHDFGEKLISNFVKI